MRYDPYPVLRVGYTAPQDTVRARYLEAAKAAHPDKGGTPEGMAAITEAWAALGTPAARADTDARLRLLGLWPAALCPRCSGKGVALKGKGFTGGVWVPCQQCKGEGR